MKVIIAGSRDITFWGYLEMAIAKSGFKITTVVCGGARGVDTLGENWAKENKVDVHYFLPDWSIGKQAGFIRNQQMADYADALIAIWDGKSRGTRHMIMAAQANGLKVYVHHVP